MSPRPRKVARAREKQLLLQQERIEKLSAMTLAQLEEERARYHLKAEQDGPKRRALHKGFELDVELEQRVRAGDPVAIFGRRLTLYRIKRGFLISELASLLGINRTTLRKLESGRNTTLTVELLVEISEALDLSIDWLLFSRKTKKGRIDQ